MKHCLPYIFIFAFTGFAVSSPAQALISVTPNPVEKNFSADLSNLDLDLEIHTEVKNLSKDTLRLKWQRYETEKPSAWQTQVCDPNFCYLPNVSTNYNPQVKFEEPVILAPGKAFTLILHVLPNGVDGKGTIDLDFSLTKDASKVIERVKFSTRITDRTTSLSDPGIGELRLFPNPASDYFEMDNSDGLDQIVVYNLLGRPIRQYNAANGMRYYLSGLPDGMYLVSLVSRDQGILRTLRLSKRGLRP